MILAVTPSISADALDWLNLNRPLVADLRLNIVLWCEGDAAAILARGAPDFFDWISARVDCPPAPAAFAVADVKAAIRARAHGIAWAGPGLEETLAAVRPNRPIRRVAATSYQSMLDALRERARGWLFLDGIDTAFHLRRLRWAMAETGRRVIVFRGAIDDTLPGWWTVHAGHLGVAEVVRDLAAAGGSGRLAALAELDPDAVAHARVLLRNGVEGARMEALLTASPDPRAALQELAQADGWTTVGVFTETSVPPSTAMHRAFAGSAARRMRDDDAAILALRAGVQEPERWIELGTTALVAGDFEVAIRWLNAAVRSLPDDASPQLHASALVLRGHAHLGAGQPETAREDLERADVIARDLGDPSMIARAAAWLGQALLALGEPRRASEHLEAAVDASATLGAHEDMALLLDTLAMSRVAERDPAGARPYLERALAIKQRLFATEDHHSIARSLASIGGVLAVAGERDDARRHLEHSLRISDRLGDAQSPNIVPALRVLAFLDRESGDLRSARTHLERALAILRTALGSDHPETAVTLVMLARTLAAGGDLDDACTVLEQALAVQLKLAGGHSQFASAITRREFAEVLAAKGDLTGAIDQLQQALAALRGLLERDDPNIAATLRELERLQALQRDVQRAD